MGNLITTPSQQGGSGTVTVPDPPGLGRAARKRKPVGLQRAVWRMRAEVGLLTLPGLVVFTAFVIWPVLMAAYYGFFKWKGYGAPTDFAGLNNYKTIVGDPQFHAALKHNGFIMVMSLVLQAPVAIGIALLLNKKVRGRSIIRVLVFVPYVISEVIAGTGWSLMLSAGGAINSVLAKVGLTESSISWLSDPKVAIWSLMIIICWKYIGFATIIMLSGLQGIPEELLEAAAIDGASYWKAQWHITLPLLGPTIRIWVFLSIIGSLQIFDLVYIVWGQYVAHTAGTSTLATYMVVKGRDTGNYGYGNAVAVVIFLISLFIALIYQRFVLRRDTEGALTGDKKR